MLPHVNTASCEACHELLCTQIPAWGPESPQPWSMHGTHCKPVYLTACFQLLVLAHQPVSLQTPLHLPQTPKVLFGMFKCRCQWLE